MLTETEKLKRQAEILGLCLPVDRKEITIPDLSELFDVSIPTIDRDLQDLRSLGIPIHSQKGLGVIVDRNNNHKAIESVLLNYISICHSENLADIIGIANDSEHSLLLLEIFIKLRLAIETSKKIKLKWSHSKNGETITPVQVIMKGNEWYLIYITEEYITVENLNQIKEIEITNENSKRIRIENVEKILGKIDEYSTVNKFIIRITYTEKKLGFFAPMGFKLLNKKHLRKNRVELDGVCSDLNRVIIDLFENRIDYSMKILEYKPVSCREIAKTHVKLIEKDDGHVVYYQMSNFDDFFTPRATNNVTTNKGLFDKVRIDEQLANLDENSVIEPPPFLSRISDDDSEKGKSEIKISTNREVFSGIDRNKKEEMIRVRRIAENTMQNEGKLKKFFKFLRSLHSD